MFHFQRANRAPWDAEPEDASAAAADGEEQPLRLRLAAAGSPADEPRPSAMENLYIYPSPHQAQLLELRFSAIRYDLEARGGRKPGKLEIWKFEDLAI